MPSRFIKQSSLAIFLLGLIWLLQWVTPGKIKNTYNFIQANKHLRITENAQNNSSENFTLDIHKEDGNNVRLLCWIMADPKGLTKVTHIKNTWGKRCDKFLVMSSEQDDNFPAIGLNVSAGRLHLADKCQAAWTYIYQHYIDDYDFFVKADTDTYIVVDNLRLYLKNEDPAKPYFYGHRYRVWNGTFIYMSGGPGYVLSRNSVRRLVTEAFFGGKCKMREGDGEDWKVCRCLKKVGCIPRDTRDSESRQRFMVFPLASNIQRIFPKWYFEFEADEPVKGYNCCSTRPISFHYVKSPDMYTLEFWFYHLKRNL